MTLEDAVAALKVGGGLAQFELAGSDIPTPDLVHAMLTLVAALAQRGGVWPSQVAEMIDDVDYPLRLVERRNWPKQKTTEGGS